MTKIALDRSRDGLAGFPATYEPIARDELGDVLATDSRDGDWIP